MFKRLFNPIGFVRDLLLAQFGPFKWSERELETIKQDGFTDGEILISEAVINSGGPGWIKRTVK